MKTNQRTIEWFRKTAIAEGLSFLILLLVAMPLKYFAGLPQAVTFFGWVHGILFVAFLALSLETMRILNKSFLWFIKAFVSFFLPFGTFVLVRQMKKAGDFEETNQKV